MRIIHYLVFTLAPILNSIELSTQYEWLPNDDPTSGVPRGGPSSSFSSDRHAEPSLRQRSESPPDRDVAPLTSLPSSDGHGYGLDQLPFIRLVSNKNPNWQFELRRYTFPANKTIRILGAGKIYQPVPTGKQIVLSTFGGDVFGVLQSTYLLVGIYAYNPATQRIGRAKINMESGKITPLSPEENKEIPIGISHQLLHSFTVKHVNHNERSPAELSLRGRSRSPTSRFQGPPTRLPSFDGRGYELDQLEFIRLVSYKNPNLVFEFQKYTFPANIPLSLHQGNNRYESISTEEQIVLSTLDGDVFAILESMNVLVGIYTYNPPNECKGRAKYNMESRRITWLTSDEMKEVPVGPHRQISAAFRVEHVDHNEGSRFPSSRHIDLPEMLPSSDGSLYGLDQLQFLVLHSIKYPNRIFELQRYKFPENKPLLLPQGKNRFVPLPAQEYIVLSTLAGDVFAILENSRFFVGIYARQSRPSHKGRVKINMRSGEVTPLTADEMEVVPVGRSRAITAHFRVQHVKYNT